VPQHLYTENGDSSFCQILVAPMNLQNIIT